MMGINTYGSSGVNKTGKFVLLLVAIICFMYEGKIGEVDYLNNYILRNYAVSCEVCILLIRNISSRTLHSLLRYKMLLQLGKISYSLYLYHLISLFSVNYLVYGKLSIILILSLSFLFSFFIIYIVISIH